MAFKAFTEFSQNVPKSSLLNDAVSHKQENEVANDNSG
jgi:hypothetical protein